MIGSQVLPPTSESKQRSSDHRPASESPEDADSTFDPGIDDDLASAGASVAGEQLLPPCNATADFCPENGSPASDVRRSSSAGDPDPGPLARALEGTIVADGKYGASDQEGTRTASLEAFGHCGDEASILLISPVTSQGRDFQPAAPAPDPPVEKLDHPVETSSPEQLEHDLPDLTANATLNDLDPARRLDDPKSSATVSALSDERHTGNDRRDRFRYDK